MTETIKYTVQNTNIEDLPEVMELFEQTINFQGKNGYKVWDEIDKLALIKDIESGHQYKIVLDTNILSIFSIQFSDLFIWRERDQNDAIYLHRIVVNPKFKGQKLFEKVLECAKLKAKQLNLSYVRMDTWADNEQLINYYKSFGFQFIENYSTGDAIELPIQNRNLKVALLELSISTE